MDKTTTFVSRVLEEVDDELGRQDVKWGEQNHPDGTGLLLWREHAEMAEAFAEKDPVRLREELVQVAAVAVQWLKAIDRRQRKVDDALQSVRAEGLEPSERVIADLRSGRDPEEVFQEVLRNV